MSLRPRIIVSLLMDAGRLIKTQKFSDPKYVGDPINAVKIFNEKRVDELAIFDIGAWRRQELDFRLLKKISNEANMPLCYGGGVRTSSQAADLVGIGFEKVSISSQAVQSPQLIKEVSERIGAQSTVVTLDVRRKPFRSGWNVFIENGKRKVGVSLRELLTEFSANGAGELILNHIDRDGTMTGYDLELAKFSVNSVSIPTTFLGGAGTVEDMARLIEEVGTVGVAAGSMFVFKGIHRAVLITYEKPSVSMNEA